MFAGYDQQRKDKVGLTRSKYFSCLAALCKAGLAHKDKHGNYALAKASVVRGDSKHRCTLLIERGMDIRSIRDMLYLKFVEMASRQVITRIKPVETKRNKAALERRRLIMDGDARHQARTKILENPPLGQTKAEVVKLAGDGYAPMNTLKLMNVTGLGRSALFAWKKRVKDKKWIHQVDRSEVIPPEILPVILRNVDLTQSFGKGKVTFSVSQGHKFTQASAYKMLIKY